MPDKPRLRRSVDAPHPRVGLVHLGPGAFFRAFVATYTRDAVRAKGGDWGISAVSLRSPTVRDKLKPQGYAYTSVALTPQGAEFEVIDIIQEMLVAPEDPSAVLSVMAAPEVRIVSMTLTEKGYCHNPASRELRLDHPDIAYDLAHPQSPRSAPGFLVHALALRRAAGLPPFTILSCDNLPDNGALTRRIVLAFARALDTELADWIAQRVCFPATMVDRITPATTANDITTLEEMTGYRDEGCVTHEPFRQWVIEDNFSNSDHPRWDLAGAQFVKNVAAFETMKLRCLNGTHSALAYLGYLAGYETIAKTVADPLFAQLIDYLWSQEIIPTVPQPEGEDLAAYCATLKTRYLNPAIRHRTWQIAMDGSQKLPQRLLGTISDNLNAGREISGLTLSVAAWMRYVGGIDEQGKAIDVRDPLADKLRAASDAADNPTDKVSALLAFSDVFDPALAESPEFRAELVAAYTQLAEQGTKSAVMRVLTASFRR